MSKNDATTKSHRVYNKDRIKRIKEAAEQSRLKDPNWYDDAPPSVIPKPEEEENALRSGTPDFIKNSKLKPQPAPLNPNDLAIAKKLSINELTHLTSDSSQLQDIINSNITKYIPPNGSEDSHIDYLKLSRDRKIQERELFNKQVAESLDKASERWQKKMKQFNSQTNPSQDSTGIVASLFDEDTEREKFEKELSEKSAFNKFKGKNFASRLDFILSRKYRNPISRNLDSLRYINEKSYNRWNSRVETLNTISDLKYNLLNSRINLGIETSNSNKSKKSNKKEINIPMSNVNDANTTALLNSLYSTPYLNNSNNFMQQMPNINMQHPISHFNMQPPCVPNKDPQQINPHFNFNLNPNYNPYINSNPVPTLNPNPSLNPNFPQNPNLNLNFPHNSNINPNFINYPQFNSTHFVNPYYDYNLYPNTINSNLQINPYPQNYSQPQQHQDHQIQQGPESAANLDKFYESVSILSEQLNNITLLVDKLTKNSQPKPKPIIKNSEKNTTESINDSWYDDNDNTFSQNIPNYWDHNRNTCHTVNTNNRHNPLDPDINTKLAATLNSKHERKVRFNENDEVHGWQKSKQQTNDSNGNEHENSDKNVHKSNYKPIRHPQSISKIYHESNEPRPSEAFSKYRLPDVVNTMRATNFTRNYRTF